MKTTKFENTVSIVQTVEVILVVLFMCFFIPVVFGFKTYVIQSGSMEPNIPTGSIVYVKPINANDVKYDDVIAFRIDNMAVTHRVTEIHKNDKCFTTKGDANEAADPKPVPFDNLIGKVQFSIRYAGYPIMFLKTLAGKIVMGGIVIINVILCVMVNMTNKKRTKERKMMFMKSIKNKKGIIAALALCSVMLVGGATAYFTDTDTAKNTVTVGKVTIDLDEPTWDSTPDDDHHNIVPGQEIKKDPKVTNTGKNDAYIYLTVSVPKAKIITANADGSLANNGAATTTQLFTYKANSDWKLLKTDTSATDKNVYVYGYSKVVIPSAKTTTLFDSVKFVNAIEGQGLEEKSFDIDVKASAIQSDESGTMEEAYEKLINQSK